MSNILKTAGYGWKPDLPDYRDHMYEVPVHALAQVPAKFDVVAGCPPVYNQYQIGSCTANSTGAMAEFVQKKEGLIDFTPSRLYLYYNSRVKEGTVDQDAGAMLRDVLQALAENGVCRETMWDYNASRLTEKPTNECYQHGALHRAIRYQAVPQTLDAMKACLLSGYPFVFGFTVYDGFESEEVAQSGTLNLPTSEENMVGGHAVMAVGYDDTTQRILVQNSWGNSWGIGGRFTMPYEYILNPNLASDFWTLRVLAAK